MYPASLLLLGLCSAFSCYSPQTRPFLIIVGPKISFFFRQKHCFVRKTRKLICMWVLAATTLRKKKQTSGRRKAKKKRKTTQETHVTGRYSSLKKARLSDGNLVPNHGYWAVPIPLNVHRAKFLLLPILFEVARRCQEVAMQQVRGRERSDRICSSRLVLSPCSPTGRQDERQTGITGVYIVTRIRWPVFTK